MWFPAGRAVGLGGVWIQRRVQLPGGQSGARPGGEMVYGTLCLATVAVE